MRPRRGILVTACLSLLFGIVLPVAALPVPSKITPGQTLSEREAELALIKSVVERGEVAAALEAHGLTQEQIHYRLARFSPEELHALSSQLDQLQAAGAAVPDYIWILLAVFLGVLIITAIF